MSTGYSSDSIEALLHRSLADPQIDPRVSAAKSSRTDWIQLRTYVHATFPGQWRYDRRFCGSKILTYLAYLDTRLSLYEIADATSLGVQEVADEIHRIDALGMESEVMAQIISKIRGNYVS